MPSIDFNSLLKKHGLICHSFAYNDLPINIKDKLGIENNEAYKDNYLSLIANVGPRFWNEMQARQSEWINHAEAVNNPVDFFSTKVTEQLLQLAGLTVNAQMLYPGTVPAPLILLGELANWSTPSPLGLGLHPRYGPWFAYRALVKTTSPMHTHDSNTVVTSNSASHRVSNASSSDNADTKPDLVASPCLSCASVACVSACPGSAVSFKDSFNIGRCASYRLKENTLCKKQCHARNACPVGVEHR